MGKGSKISWTDHTFNPWIGCTKVSQGCKNCYAERLMDERYGRVEWGPQGTRDKTSVGYWRKPIRWNTMTWMECSDCGYRGNQTDWLYKYKPEMDACPECGSSDSSPTTQRVFCASLADVFEKKNEIKPWRRELWKLIAKTPNLNWLILTKRLENVYDLVPARWWDRWPAHIWLGTSVEDQETANERIPKLLEIPARVRFISAEPLLDRIYFKMADFSDRGHGPGWLKAGNAAGGPEIDWVIVGGESGPNARPMKEEWAVSIRNQCLQANTPFFFKQGSQANWGNFRDFESFPEHLQIREFPETLL